ncbi:MAG TPA: hypothetical protein VIX37_07015 [Candidatus Sulfotelmatobacter sp.]
MKSRRLGCVLLAFPFLAWGQATSSPANLLHEGLTAMGGEQKIRALSTLHIQSSVVRSMLEQSERPEGPYILENDQVEEWRDLAHGNWKRTVKAHVSMQPEFVMASVVSAGAASVSFDGHVGPGSGEPLQDAAAALALSPEGVLITALASPDLHRLPDLTLQSVPHHEVEFTWQGSPVRIFLNADTHLPTAVEWVAAYPFGVFWSVWGDVTTRVYYSFWWLQNGIHYPLQKDVFGNGLPDQTETITKIEFNQSPSADEFAITPEIRTAFAARANKTIDDRAPNTAGASELAPGVWFIAGNWNTTLIRQDDGIVVLEAPISSGYSAKVLDFAQTRFPGVRIKAVITTSDSWPHIGGVREYVARGIPVYVLDRTVPLIERFLRAPRTKYPDSLAKAPHPADLRAVAAKTTIGSGPNRLELYPIHGETSERQMMVYFPEHKLLYGSDPFQQLEDGKLFYPQTVCELQNAVEREHLSVERFFMMHLGPNPWSMVPKTVQAAN